MTSVSLCFVSSIFVLFFYPEVGIGVDDKDEVLGDPGRSVRHRVVDFVPYPRRIQRLLDRPAGLPKRPRQIPQSLGFVVVHVLHEQLLGVAVAAAAAAAKMGDEFRSSGIYSKDK